MQTKLPKKCPHCTGSGGMLSRTSYPDPDPGHALRKHRSIEFQGNVHTVRYPDPDPRHAQRWWLHLDYFSSIFGVILQKESKFSREFIDLAGCWRSLMRIWKWLHVIKFRIRYFGEEKKSMDVTPKDKQNL
ncbi:uncharacterized protein LOC129744009 [Uranotaenia lowii]|uniref:uncharacterized protein LOC129744009 n=1 Tax=Uranotaenia lowii TaxID=190385 RepID=UPI00247A6F1E|nr:uncharacterized protein LOC129744009 [Uranotaenia lowii]